MAEELKRPNIPLEKLETKLIQEILNQISDNIALKTSYTVYLYDKNHRITYIINEKEPYIKEDKYLYLNVVEYEETSYGSNKRYVKLNLYEFDLNIYVLFLKTRTYTDSSKKKQLNRELKKAIRDYKEYWDYYNQPNIEQIEQERRDSIRLRRTYGEDENNRVVTKADLERALQAVRSGAERMDHESRPVIINEKFCINASAAIEETDDWKDYTEKRLSRKPTKDGDLLYRACEGSGDYKGYYVCFADEYDILAAIAKCEE